MLFLLDIHQSSLFAYAVFKCTADCFRDANIILRSDCINIEFSRHSSLRQFNVIMPEDFVRVRTVGLCANNTVGCITIYDETVTKLNLSASNPNFEVNGVEGTAPIEFVFLFHIQSNDVIEQCIVRKSDSPMYFRDVMYDQYKEIEACKIICTNCGVLLTENFINIVSVHKYYEGKSELEETSFCHQHDDDHTDVPEVNVNSLFIDDMYFYFHHSILANFQLLEENSTYKCFKCTSTLSFQKKMDNLQYIGFFSDKIMLTKSPDDEIDYEKYKINACLLSFYSIIEEIFKEDLAPKLYLQSKVGETTEVLLLWIDAEKVVQFVLEESDENEPQENVELKGIELFSVLYYSTAPESDLSREWKHDFNVEFFQVSDNMMKALKGLFQERPDFFSEWKESNPGFSFGYFPVEIPIS